MNSGVIDSGRVARPARPWPMVRLGDVCETISVRGHQIKQSEILPTGRLPVVSQSENIIEGYTNQAIAIREYPLILFGDHTCNVKLINRPFVVGADGVKLLRVADTIPEFLYFWMKQAASHLSDGKYRRHYSDLCKMLFPLPPLSIQREIVGRLEKELGKADELAAKSKQLVELAEELFKSELDAAFKNVKGEKVRLGDVFNVVSARRVHKSEWKTKGIPFYRAREIVKLSNNGVVDNELFISRELYEMYRKTNGVPMPGDLMVSGVGTIGRVYVVKECDRFYYKDASVLCYENRKGVNPNYAKYYLEAPSFLKLIHEESMGATVDTITMQRANEYPFVKPTNADQREIVARLDAARERSEKLKAAAERGAALAVELRKSILQEAFA